MVVFGLPPVKRAHADDIPACQHFTWQVQNGFPPCIPAHRGDTVAKVEDTGKMARQLCSLPLGSSAKALYAGTASNPTTQGTEKPKLRELISEMRGPSPAPLLPQQGCSASQAGSREV